jgi:hypothetical protein
LAPWPPRINNAISSGVITVIKLGEKFEVVATNTLADHLFVVAPVVAEGEIFCGARLTASESATPRCRKYTDTLIALAHENQFLGQLQFFIVRSRGFG